MDGYSLQMAARYLFSGIKCHTSHPFVKSPGSILGSRMEAKVAYYKKSVLVTGRGVKDEVEDVGKGVFNRTLNGWIFPKRKLNAVLNKLESLPGVELVDETAAGSTSNKKKGKKKGRGNKQCRTKNSGKTDLMRYADFDYDYYV